jgi:enoyl-CoA hydratase/carnithine racemase
MPMIGSSRPAQKGARMSDFETIRYQVNDGVATITLARPEKRNAVSLGMFRELGDVAQTAGRDPAVRAVVVAGEGSSFCAGIDLGLLAQLGPLAADSQAHPDGFGSFVRMAQRPFFALATMPKPTLAAVQGHALGAGFQLALACDLRVAATDVRFGMFEARYGLIPDLGGMYHLARLVGPARTKELVWTTRTVDAEEAERLGLVNAIARPDDLTGATQELLRSCIAHFDVGLSLTKALIDGALARTLEEEMSLEAEAQAITITGAGNPTA